jgi:hypothetical protein
VVCAGAALMRLPVLPPDASAFALAARNFDALDVGAREAWQLALVTRAKSRELPLPERVIVELVNTCNLDCPMCRVGEHGVDLRRVMSLDRFRSLTRALLGGASEVRLNGLGETTLLPNLGSYLDELDKTALACWLVFDGKTEASIGSRWIVPRCSLGASAKAACRPS